MTSPHACRPMLDASSTLFYFMGTRYVHRPFSILWVHVMSTDPSLVANTLFGCEHHNKAIGCEHQNKAIGGVLYFFYFKASKHHQNKHTSIIENILSNHHRGAPIPRILKPAHASHALRHRRACACLPTRVLPRSERHTPVASRLH